MKSKKRDRLNQGKFAVLILLASIYLTFLVDVYTLNTWAKRIFIFGYFCVMGLLMMRIRTKYLGKEDRKQAILSVFLATIVLFVFYNSFIPDWESKELILRANTSEEYPTGEVWFTGAEVDGEFIEASELENLSANNWIFNTDYDDYVFYPSEGTADNSLSFYTLGESVVLRFGSNPWSGSVLIEQEGSQEFVSLYANDAAQEPLSYKIQDNVQRSVPEQLLLGLGALVVLSFLISTLISGMLIYVPLHTVIAVIAYMLSAFLLFGTSPLIDPAAGTKILLAALTVGIILLGIIGNGAIMMKYRSRGKRFIIGLIAVYASLASFAYRFFLYGDTRPVFSTIGAAYCLLGVVWFVPLIHAQLYILECSTRERTNCMRHPQEKRRAFFTLFVVLCLCQCVALFSFWPGAFPSDCYDQLCQVFGVYGLNDWHPVIHTLFFRLILNTFHAAGAITAVQMFFFVLLVALVLLEGYNRGIRLLPLCIGGSLFLLLPNQVFSTILVEKDFSYSLALLWATWLIYRMTHPESKKGVLFFIAVTVNLFLVCTVRHNGIVPFIVMILFYLWLAMRKKEERVRLSASVLAAILLVTGYKGPLFKALHVQENEMSGYSVMLCAVGSCINKDLPLSEKTNDIMAKVMPMEDWKTYYGRFVGHDQYMWGGGSGMNISAVSGKEVFSAYFDALFHYPDVVIKDRLDGTNLLWDVKQPVDGYNNVELDAVDGRIISFNGLFDYSKLSKEGSEESLFYRNRSKIAELYRTSFTTEPNQALDMLLWRSGAYLILLWVLLLFWITNRRDDLLACVVPMLGNLCGLILVLYHQSFRYIFAVQLLIVTLLFFTLITPNNISLKHKMIGT